LTTPLIFGGIITLCSSKREFSKTVPIISPPFKSYPILILELGTYSHSYFSSTYGTSAPLGINTDPDYSAITFNGL